MTWMADEPVVAFAKALEQVSPNDIFVIYPGAVDGPPKWTISPFFNGYRGELPIRAKMTTRRAYGDGSVDPFAERPVGLRDLIREVGASRVDAIVEELLAPMGVQHQLRSVLFDPSGDVALYIGLYRAPHARPYDVADHARLYAIQPILRRWVALASDLGFEPLGDGALTAAIDAWQAPALLMRGPSVVFANRAARARVVACGSATTLELTTAAPRIPLRTKSAAIDLVMLPPAPAVRLAGQPMTWEEATARLPAYLVPVAQRLHEGLSDKEITAQMGCSLATARTYVQRVLQRLGVQDRRAVMRLM